MSMKPVIPMTMKPVIPSAARDPGLNGLCRRSSTGSLVASLLGMTGGAKLIHVRTPTEGGDGKATDAPVTAAGGVR